MMKWYPVQRKRLPASISRISGVTAARRLAEKVGEGGARLHGALVRPTVDGDPEPPLHAVSPRRSSAIVSVRSARTAATRRRYSAVAWGSPSGERRAAAARAASAISAGV